MSIEFERELPELDLELVNDPDRVKQIVMDGQLQLYENELELLDESGLGLSLNRLNEFQQTFIFNYIDGDVYNEFNYRKTKGDLVNAFIMSFDNYEEITNSIYNVYEEPVKWDREGDPIHWDLKSRVGNRVLYQKWKLRAIKYWAENNLQDFTQDYKKLLEGNLSRAEQIKEVVFNDALDENASENFRLANRKMALVTEGLNNVKISHQVDYFNSGGKALKHTIDEIAEPQYNFIDEIEIVDKDD